jgi:hypothetical protein
MFTRTTRSLVAGAAAAAAVLAVVTAAIYLYRRAPPPPRERRTVLTSLSSPPSDADFPRALAFFRSRGDALPVALRLEMYGIFKAAEFSRAGRPSAPQFPRPSSLSDPTGAAKWDAWNAAATATTHDACDVPALERRYVALLDAHVPGWRDDNADGADGASGGCGSSASAAAADAVGATIGFYPMSQPLVAQATDAEIAAQSVDPHVIAREPSADAMRALLAAAEARAAGGALALASARNSSGETPLHFAADAGAAETVRVLIAAGADVNACEAVEARTPLHYAAAQGHAGAIDALVDACADASAKDADGLDAAAILDGCSDISGEERARLVARLTAAT